MILETSGLQELLSNFPLSTCSNTEHNQKFEYLLVDLAGGGSEVNRWDSLNWPFDNAEFEGREILIHGAISS